ncbi:MAG: DUF5659 domain-containing protein [Patescibacteria group bacterium]|nr:DUF5659 domain-containing protein [Patescibacteria group bacterium]
MINDNEFLKTSDFYLASYLLAKNIPLVKLNKENPQGAVFVFSKNKECLALCDEFSQMKASIEPIAYPSAQKRLKHLLFLYLKT